MEGKALSLLQGCAVRRRLVRAVRREYGEVAAECEGGIASLISWPAPATLCFPRFSRSSGVAASRCQTNTPQLQPGELGSLSQEQLLELRAQLSMELLWTRQAIASRQKYLRLRRELSKN